MYKIIGADGKEYGPISTDILKKWLAEGRINAQTKVLPEGATEWKALGEIPELAAGVTTAAPAPISAAPGYSTGATPAADQVNGPAIGLMVTAGIGFLLQAAGIALNALGIGIGAMQQRQAGGPEALANMLSGSMGIVSGVIGLIVGIIIFLGALKMKKLQSYGWAMTASILAMVPCVSPCCIIGLPIGIWAIVVLSKAEVKSQFH